MAERVLLHHRVAVAALLPLAAGFAVVGCGGRAKSMMTGSATVSNEQVWSGSTTRPSVVYVADFSVAPGAIAPPEGIVDQTTEAMAERPRLLGGGLLRGGLLGGGESGASDGEASGGSEGGGGIGHRLLDSQPTPAQVVDVLASSVTDSLNQMQLGVSAVRLPSGVPLPASGWLVRGRFTSVDPGSRAQRAVIGFGAGEATTEVQAELDQLGPGGASPIADFGSQADSGKAPGAVVTMNPYVAAAKFVMAKNATGRDVKSMGEAIAKRVAAFVDAQSPAAAAAGQGQASP